MTVIQWFSDKLFKDFGFSFSNNILKEALEKEKQQRLSDYNTGYNDASCNHINDAEQYIDQTSRNL